MFDWQECFNRLSKLDSVFSGRTLRYCERLMLFISNHLSLMPKEIANFEMQWLADEPGNQIRLDDLSLKVGILQIKWKWKGAHKTTHGMCGQLERSRIFLQSFQQSFGFAMAASFTTAIRLKFLLTVSTVISHFLTLKLNTLKWRTARRKHEFSV